MRRFIARWMVVCSTLFAAHVTFAPAPSQATPPAGELGPEVRTAFAGWL